ncbi:MAG TPA: AAA family ATPase [Stellaceae bacterium]
MTAAWRADEPTIPIPPSNTEAEQALLGAIFVNNVAYSRVAGFLAPEHFFLAVHGRIYAAIGTLVDRGQTASPVALKNLFDQDGALAEIGGVQYLMRLAESAVTIINAEHYGRTLLDLAQRRAMLAVLEDAVAKTYSCDIDRPAADVAAHAVEQLQKVDQIGAGSAALGWTVAADLAGAIVPDRPWLVPHWLPSRQVTLLSGDGGVGKSLLAMSLQIATATATRWLGLSATPCRSIGVYAEDEEDELHRRLVGLAELAGVDVAALGNMSWHSAVADQAELVEADESGGVRPTQYFRQVERRAVEFKARLVVLDAVTNLFGGDEIKRRQVNAYVGLLRRLAIKIDGAVLLLAHPSAAGISTGSGLSGSTHWNNAVRSRLYLTRTTGEDADPDERELTRLKANYAGAGDVLRLRWQRGGFVALDEPTGVDRAALGAKADRVFRSLLTATYAEGTWTSPNPAAPNYAPRTFSKRPDREGLGKPAFEAAMHRMLRAAEVKTETYGPPSQGRRRLSPA